MSTSLLHHGFGLNDQQYLKTEYKGGVVYFHIRTNEEKLQCSVCHSFNVIKKDTIERLFRTVPIGLKPVMLKAQIQRLECKDCSLVRQERIRFAEEKKLHQKIRQICELSVKKRDNSGCCSELGSAMEYSQAD